MPDDEKRIETSRAGLRFATVILGTQAGWTARDGGQADAGLRYDELLAALASDTSPARGAAQP